MNHALNMKKVICLAFLIPLGRVSGVMDTGGICDPQFEICFRGIGDLPGGTFLSVANGIARDADGNVVVVGESSSAASQGVCNGCVEAVKFSNGSLKTILTGLARSTAKDVGLSGGMTFIVGTAGQAYRAVQSGDTPVAPELLPLPPFALGISGTGISDDGLVISGNESPQPGQGSGAFRWRFGIGTQSIPILDPNGFKASNFANGVSPNGSYVVGGSSAVSCFEGFAFPPPGELCIFPPGCVTPVGMGDLPGGICFSSANAISNFGVAVGRATTDAGEEAFRWIPGSLFPFRPAVIRGLGDFPGGAFFSEALDISGSGVLIVGKGTTGEPGIGNTAFLWHQNLGMRHLRDLVNEFPVNGLSGWQLSDANAISSDGLAIAGNGRNPGGQSEGWFLTLPDCNANGTWDAIEALAPLALQVPEGLRVLSFDGVDDFVEAASPTADLRITGPLTVEMWVNPHRLGVNQRLIGFGEAGESLDTNFLYLIELDPNGDIRVFHERSNLSDGEILFDTNLQTGRWYHIALTRSFVSTVSIYNLYIDELPEQTDAISGLPAGGAAGKLRIGLAEGATSDRPFDGYMGDVRIWNVTRTTEEIRASMFAGVAANSAGLMGYWPLNEASGTTLQDLTGRNALTLTGPFRTPVAYDCNNDRVPDGCQPDCNHNGTPDDCDIRDAISFDCNGNSIPEECDLVEFLEDIYDPQQQATQFFRENRDNPTEPVTFGTMIQQYGRPWKPGTGQTPGGGVCQGGSQNGAACAGPQGCPGGSCVPPAGTGINRDPAERLRMLARSPNCLSADAAQQVFEQLHAYEMLLGNEAYSDALDPTVGEGALGEVISLELVPDLFSFRGVPSVFTLLDEELALLAGREIPVPASAAVPLNDEPAADINGNYPQFGAAPRTAIYNRIRPNAVNSLGSIAYRSNYGFTNTTDNAMASTAFPQGHGDAYGYYLTAIKTYLDPFGAGPSSPDNDAFALNMIRSQTSSTEDCTDSDCETFVDDDGLNHQVGFQSVRNMAVAMAAKARTANRLVDLTFRRDYRENTDTDLLDLDRTRARGLADWARRGAVGAYLDWAVLNQLLPVGDETRGTGLEVVDRNSVDEILALNSAAEEMQERVDAAGSGLNPLGLVPNVVPFRIIQPGQLLNFLEGGANAGQSHYGIVRSAALEAIQNARGILRRANQALNRLRGNESEQSDFEGQLRESDAAQTNRLIEIFGLPSVSDQTDNDFEDNDGDGVQMVGGLNDPDDDILESGCGGECPGSPDLRNFMIDSEGAAFLGFEERLAVGEIQLAMFGLRSANIKIQIAEAELTRMESLIEAKAENVALVREESVDVLEINAQACNERVKVIDRKQQMAQARQERGWLSSIGGLIVSGIGCYVSGGATCGDTIGKALSFFGDAVGGFNSRLQEMRDQFDLEREELRINCWQTAELSRISSTQSIRTLEIELEDLMRQTPQAILNLALAQNEAVQALAVVNKGIQEGRRLIDDRARARRVRTDKLQQFRWKDMAFRTFRNQSLEQYGAFFDLAARYVMLAARAFAYEYNERDEVDAQMRNLHRERLLGTEFAGDQGLQSIIARLDQERQTSDFASRIQKLSLFDHQGDEFSFRKNGMGLAINPATDTDQQQQEKNRTFRAALESNLVQELLDVPAFRQLASFDSQRDAGPALVLTFPTEVAGRTYFGKRRGTTFGAPANFDTCSNPKVFEFAILLEGVDNPSALGVDSVLIFAHFLPVGSSMLREPLSGDCAFRPVRSWSVVDQRIPGVSAAYRENGSAILSAFDLPRLATASDLNIINRFPVSQAQIRQTENPVFQDDLAGWSAWNTQWLLAIPGRQFADPNDPDDVVREKLLILIYDADETGRPRDPNENLGIDDIKLRIKAYGKPS